MSGPTDIGAIRALLEEYVAADRDRIDYQDWGMVDERVDAAGRRLAALGPEALPALDILTLERTRVGSEAAGWAKLLRVREARTAARGAQDQAARAPEALARALHDRAKFWVRRARVLEEMLSDDDERAAALLLAIAGDDPDRLAESIATVGSVAEGAIARGVRALLERERSVSEWFFDVLRGRSPIALVRRLLATKGRLRDETLWAVAALADQQASARELEAAWHARPEPERRAIVEALARARAPEVRRAALARWIDDPAPDVRIAALEILKHVATLDHLDAALQILRDDPDPRARDAAGELAHWIGASGRHALADLHRALHALRTAWLERPASRRAAMHGIVGFRRIRAGEGPFASFAACDRETFERTRAGLAPEAPPGFPLDLEEIVVAAHAFALSADPDRHSILVAALSHPRGDDLAPHLVDLLVVDNGLAAIADALRRGAGYRSAASGERLRDRIVAAVPASPSVAHQRYAQLAHHADPGLRDLGALVARKRVPATE